MLAACQGPKISSFGLYSEHPGNFKVEDGHPSSIVDKIL